MLTGVYIRTYFNPKGVCQNTGRTHFSKGHIPFNKGVPFSEEVKRKMSIARLGKIPWNKGLKGVQTAWNKGTAKPKIKKTNHHILNFSQYPELRFAIDNGITLSVEAHDQFHKIYGKRNNTREQLEEFLQKKI